MKDYSVKTLSYSQTKFQTFESSQFQLCKEQALFYEIYICYIIVTKRNLHLLNNFHKFNVIERRLRHFLTIFHKTRISKKKKRKKICNVQNYNSHEFSFERTSIATKSNRWRILWQRQRNYKVQYQPIHVVPSQAPVNRAEVFDETAGIISVSEHRCGRRLNAGISDLSNDRDRYQPLIEIELVLKTSINAVYTRQ